MRRASILWSLALSLAATAAVAQDAAKPPYRLTEDRARCAAYDPLRQPFFGDLHVHTALSFDARSQDTRNTPADAYRFARGESVGLQPFDAQGKSLRMARIDRPLDFAAVTDHSEMLGEVRICERTDMAGSDSDICWSWRALKPMMFGLMATRTMIARQRWGYCGRGGKLCTDAARKVWSEIRDAAEATYDRSAACKFTSFVGYEWTGSLGSGTNLHRNVIFRNANVPDYATSWVETPSAVDLWDALVRDCLSRKKPCDVLTIPHNSNLGSGVMFATASLRTLADANKPVTAEEARRRQRFEPLVEVMQHKGDSECLISGDTTDEACGFEKLPYNSFAGVQRIQRGVVRTEGGVDPLAPARADMVREALKRGLEEEQRLGVNPLKYGLIASTDTHLGTPGFVAERGHAGHGGAGMSATQGAPIGLSDDLEFNPGGLAVVWAEENARDSLFDAMMRRETYGTSGPRITLRFFGGWEFPKGLCSASDLAAQGYANGVPMGGDLPADRPPENLGPRFAVSALMDAGTSDAPGTPLERIQIVKGWVDAQGKRHEKVFDIASAKSEASVDPATCERSGAGAEDLCKVWRDKEFDPNVPAFYYARVLENPSCRWSQLVCVEQKVDCGNPAGVAPQLAGCCSPDHQPIIQERAWSSPIWYRPKP